MKPVKVDETTLRSLEFPGILAALAGYAESAVGREIISGLLPCCDPATIKEAFTGVVECVSIAGINNRLPIRGAQDIRPELKRLAVEGVYLDADAFLRIRDNLSVCESLRAMLSDGFNRQFPRLSQKIGRISNQRVLLSGLNRIFDDKGAIKDNASKRLYAIRKEMRALRAGARKILDDICIDKRLKDCLQEEIVTIREDRFCICVKAGKEADLGGIIHGSSSTGGTFFVEPIRLVEVNNRITCLKKEELSEEIEILKGATLEVISETSSLKNDLNIIGELDSLQARAVFAADVGATAPEVAAGMGIRFIGARHPLLAIKERSTGQRAVPIDIIIEGGVNALVISGANTGGKTVALKTIGLITLMALSGIPVPVSEGSVAYPFSAIFADIGDRQNIGESLSTFSGHIKRISYFLSEAGQASLVLLDEIGSGTDPSEGAAFAMAAIDGFKKRGATTVATTHLNALKAHAVEAVGYMNASVSFDEHGLTPLYALCYRTPGASYGLSIAKTLGIPSDVIEMAGENLEEKEASFLKSIRLLDEERERLARITGELKVLEGKRDEAVRRIRDERAEILKKIREKTNNALKTAMAEMREIIEKARDKGINIEEAKASLVERGQRLLKEPPGRTPRSFDFEEGDTVTMSGSKGVVLRTDRQGKKAEVMVGGLKVWVSWDRLEKAPKAATAKAPVKGHVINADMEVSDTINIIGMRAEEAGVAVQRFLDAAHANGLARVAIIHGMGTGALKKTVRERLSACNAIAAFYHPAQAGGGAGVTIAEFK